MTQTISKEKFTPATTVYIVGSDHIIWRGKPYRTGSRLTVTSPKKAEADRIALHVRKGWLREATEEERNAPEVQPPPAANNIVALPDQAAVYAAQPAGGPGQVQMVALERIRPDPTQPRTTFTPDGMAEMVESIKAKGVVQAIQLRPMTRWRQIVSFVARQWVRRERKDEGWGLSVTDLWAAGIKITLGEMVESSVIMARLVVEGRVERSTGGKIAWEPIAGALALLTGEATMPGEETWLEIVYGERRWRGAKEAALAVIPAKVAELTDIEAAELQAIENLKRKDLLPMEDAAQCRKLLDTPGFGMERLEKSTGWKRNTIYGKLKLLELPKEAQDAVQCGDLGAVTAERIARLKGNVQQLAIKAILHPDRRYSDSKVLTDREAKQAIETAEREDAKQRKIAEIEAAAVARGITWMQPDGAKYKEVFGYSYHPSSKSGLITLDASVPRDSKGRRYHEVLNMVSVSKHAKDLKPAFATVRNTELLELYKADDVRDVLKAAGFKGASVKREVDPHEAKQRAKDKLMNAALDRAAGVIRLRSQLFCPRVLQSAEMLGMWKALARCAVHLVRFRLDDFIRRRGIAPVMVKGHDKKERPDERKTVEAYLVNKSVSDLAGIVAELLLTHEAWNRYLGDDFQEAFLVGAAEFGLNLTKIRAEVAGGGEAEEDANAAAGAGGAEQSASARTREPQEVAA